MTFDDRPPGEVPLTTSYSVSKPAPAAADEAPPPPPADEPRIYMQDRDGPPFSRNKMIAAGLAGAVALGLFFGLVMGPKVDEPAKPKIERITPKGEDPRLQIQVTTRQAPEPTAASAGRLDAAGTVIQPAPAEARAEPEGGGIVGALGRMFGGGDDDEGRAAPAQRVERAEAPRPERRAERAPETVVAQAETDADDVAPADVDPPARVRRTASPSFNCRYARTRAEMMVCEDPRLAAADRRLATAFRRAVDSGAPYGPLRRQQDRWLAARERAAVSPEAVHMVYMQRIEELENLGEGW